MKKWLLLKVMVVFLLISAQIYAQAPPEQEGRDPTMAQPPPQESSGHVEGRTASIQEGRTGQGELLSEPPQLSPQELQRMEERLMEKPWRTPAVPMAAGTVLSSPPPGSGQPPAPPSLEAEAEEGDGPRAPNDFRFFRNSVVASTPNTLVINEPSSANNGYDILYSYNSHLALSTDRGRTWNYIDPRTNFGTPQDWGGFCCDQIVIYDPGQDIMIWELQYWQAANFNNAQRIVIYNGQNALENNAWCYFDFNPQTVGFGNGNWFDFPRMALSNNFLYWSSNVFFQNNNTASASVMMKIRLSDLANCPAGFNFTYWTFTDHFSLSPTLGAGSTMYWADHNSTSSIRIYRNAESSGTANWDNRSVNAWPTATPACPGPDGRDWCGRSDSRIQSMWVANGVIGFQWNVGQGGGYPFPNVRTVRLRESDRAVIDQPPSWAGWGAIIYPSVGVNARGHIAGPVFAGGGDHFPELYVFIWDDISPAPAPWEWHLAATSNSGPIANIWGDYVASRRYEGNSNTWLGTGWTLQGGGGNANVRPRTLWYGRERDGRPDLIVSSLSNPPSSHIVGGSFNVSNTTRNIGSADAGSSVTRFYLSTDRTRGGEDVLLSGADTVPILAIGSSAADTVAVTIPGSTSPDRYYLIGCADDTFVVSELSGTNNCRTSTTTLLVRRVIFLPTVLK